MKKHVLLPLAVAMMFVVSVSATTAGDWSTVVTGTAVKENPVQVGTGIQGTNKGYYPQNNSGTHLNKAVDLTDFKVDVKIDKLVTTDTDSWMGPSILNTGAYFDTTDPDQGQGLVMLIRPKGDGSAECGIYSHVSGNSFGSLSDTVTLNEFKEGGTYSFEFKLTDKGLDIKMNNQDLGTSSWLTKDIFKNNQGYFTFSASDSEAKSGDGTVFSKWTIEKINGQNAVDGSGSSSDVSSSTPSSSQVSTPSSVPSSASTPSVASESSVNSSSWNTVVGESSSQASTAPITAASSGAADTEKNVNTGDSAVLPIAFGILAAGAVLVVLKKRK